LILNPLRLHHMGYVVASIDAAMPGFVRSLGATWNGRVFHDHNQKVSVAFLTTRPEDAQVELVEPAGDDSPVLRFLREKGGGLHHACYEVAALEYQLSEFRARGAVIAKRPKPAVAFDGRRIAWVITAEKFLVELLEQSAGTASPAGGDDRG
jgi:methylmalonyl-CoA/ethylmalonyl-CoA epimerase